MWSSIATCRGIRPSSNSASPAPGANIRPAASPSSISSPKTPSNIACWKRWPTNRRWPTACWTGGAIWGRSRLRSGRQAFLSKLHQLVGEAPARTVAADLKSQISNLKLAKPSDRPRAFAEEARRLLGSSLVACEERFPREGAHSVLYVVVDGQVALHRPRLETLHAELCADLEFVSPVRLEVLDRATHEALERLIASGLIAPVSRAARPLHPAAETPTPLTAEELARAKSHRDRATHKIKMARLLTNGGMADEARAPLLDAALAMSRALAVEARLPEPGALDDVLSPPLAAAWGRHAIAIQDFLAQPGADGNRAAGAMAELLGIPDDVPF